MERMEQQANASNLRRAAREEFKAETAIGHDELTFKEIAEASEEALQELADIIKDSIRTLTWPSQALLNQISLLGKKCGGTRPIAIATTFYRIVMAMQKNIVREWDKKVGSRYDSAMQGSSPKIAAAIRALEMEQKTIRGEYVIQIMWDVAKYFDSLDIKTLIERAVRYEFPLEPLVMGLQVHRAPRVLKVGNTYAEVLPAIGKGIIAGCTLSTSLSRAYMKQAIEQVPEKDGHKIAEHVDDVQLNIAAKTEIQARMMALERGTVFAKAIEASG